MLQRRWTLTQADRSRLEAFEIVDLEKDGENRLEGQEDK